ncbi:hypothetical protein D9M68_565470 [compost metagenome]
MLAQRLDGRQLGLAQQEEGAGQQHGDRTGGGHGDGVVLGHVFQVVRRQRLVTRRQAGAVQGGQLLGVQLHRQAQPLGHLEHPLHLLGGKGQVFAEGVHRIQQPLVGQGRQYLGADVVDVGVGAAGVLRRQCVGGQAGGAHGDRQGFAQAPGDAQHLALAGQVQAVAGLHFQGGDAIAQQLARAPGGALQQLVLAGLAGGAHRAGDAAALGGDLGIADAFQALLELAAAVAAEHQVGVAVDQPRGEPGTFEVDLHVIGDGRQFLARTYPLDASGVGDQHRVFDDGVFAALHGGGMAVVPEVFHCSPPVRAAIPSSAAASRSRSAARAISGASQRS